MNTAGDATKSGGPLDDVKVLDFGWAVAGPVTTKYLAIAGATVIKVESRTRLDATRASEPFRGKPNRNGSGYFAYHNTGKLSVMLNLNHPEARPLVERLVRWADVVSENFSVGVMAQWGLDYPALTRLNPTIIAISSTMQGQSGPHAGHRGMGALLQAMAGVNHVTGWPDRDPVGPNAPYTDMIAPWYAAIAVLAALEHRRRTGRGQQIDVSQLEATIQFLAPAFLAQSADARPFERMGNRSASAAPHGVFRCRGEEQWVAITCLTQAQWESLAAVMDAPSLAQNERFGTLLARLRNVDELERRVEAWTADLTAEAVMTRCQALGVPAGVVATAPTLLADPHLNAREAWRVVEHPMLETYTGQAPPYQLAGGEAEMNPAPLLGEHNHAVYVEMLGMTETELQALVEKGVVA